MFPTTHSLVWKAIPAFVLFLFAVHQFSRYSGNSWTYFGRHHHHRDHHRHLLQQFELDQLEAERARESAGKVTRPSSLLAGHSSSSNGYHFDWIKDGQNAGLSDEQCDAAFPDLYVEIERAIDAWANRTITRESIELSSLNEGGLRVALQNGQIRVLQTKGMFRKDFRARIIAILHQLDQAVRHSNSQQDLDGKAALPDTEFSIVVDDYATLPQPDSSSSSNSSPPRGSTVWSFTRDLYNPHQNDLWLIPDFNFWSSNPSAAPSYSELQSAARTHDSRIEDKIPQIVWRGVLWTAPKLRKALLSVTADKEWADVKDMSWRGSSPKGGAGAKGKKGGKPRLSGWASLLSSATDTLTPSSSPSSTKNDLTSNILSPAQFCDYAFAANTEGRSWSSRLMLLLNCDSVPVSHDLRWATHFSHLLVPYVNLVPVERDFSDLPAKIQYYLDSPEGRVAAQGIADEARRTFRERYTTPAATACYWRRLVRRWADTVGDFSSEGDQQRSSLEDLDLGEIEDMMGLEINGEVTGGAAPGVEGSGWMDLEKFWKGIMREHEAKKQKEQQQQQQGEEKGGQGESGSEVVLKGIGFDEFLLRDHKLDYPSPAESD